MPLPLCDSSPLPLDAYYKACLPEGDVTELKVPFRAFGVRLDGNWQESEIHEAYLGLLQDARPWLKEETASYNVIWTVDWFILIPRCHEKHGRCSLK